MNLWSNGDSLQFTAISRAKPDTDLFRLSQFFQGYPGQFFGHVKSVFVVLIFSQEIILVGAEAIWWVLRVLPLPGSRSTFRGNRNHVV